MKKKITFLIAAVFVMVAGVFVLYNYTTREYIEKSDVVITYNEEWNPIVASVVNKNTFTLTIDGRLYKSSDKQLFMDDNRNILMEASEITDAFDCASNYYANSLFRVEKGTDVISMKLNKKEITINDVKAIVPSGVQLVEDKIYAPVNVLCNALKYSYSWDGILNQAVANNENTKQRTVPYKYNYVEARRAPAVKNQGTFGTCWAFASLTALETTLLPETNIDFSEDHMSLNNSFNISLNEGGDYNMANAYLLSWQGPVLEEDDIYGDGETNPKLKPVKHVQEVQVIEGKDIEAIKKLVFKYGGVESGIHMAGDNISLINSGYYNEEKSAYCYIGTDRPNHDVVIIGWDDDYPKENFPVELEGNGAFLCRNSWGDEFGDNGNFYVSYYDTNIGVHNVVYTKVEETNNYDNIYQSDLCGYVGMLGYGRETAYFANVYTAKDNEIIDAVGMYATGKDTEYSIYVIKNFKDESSLNKRGEANTEGSFLNAGYYTVNLDSEIEVKKGEKYAIVVKVNTPNVKRPVAIEYASNEKTSTVDLTDGKGYISLRGIDWESTEEKHDCNVCLKVYTNNR